VITNLENIYFFYITNITKEDLCEDHITNKINYTRSERVALKT